MKTWYRQKQSSLRYRDTCAGTGFVILENRNSCSSKDALQCQFAFYNQPTCN